MPRPRSAIGISLGLAALGACIAGVSADDRTVAGGALVLLGLAAAVRAIEWVRMAVPAVRAGTPLREVRYPPGVRQNSASIYDTIAIAFFGPAAGVLVAVAGKAAWWLSQRPIPARAVVTVATSAATNAVVGMTYAALAPAPRYDVGSAAGVVGLSVAGDLAQLALLLGVARVYMGHSIAGGSSPTDQLMGCFWNAAGATTLAMLYASGSSMYGPLLVGLVLALNYLLSLGRERAEKARRIELLARQALAAEERERSALAVGLHDEAIPNLLAARQELELAHEDGPDAIGRADHAIARTVDHLRDTIHDLHPAVLRHAGLATALRELAQHHGERAGLTVHLNTDHVPETADARLIYSIARELLTNVTKHADASNVTLTLTANHHGIDLTVQDDGQGFDPHTATQAPATGHIGLHTVRERTHAHGGTLTITTHPGHGTTIHIHLPAAG